MQQAIDRVAKIEARTVGTEFKQLMYDYVSFRISEKKFEAGLKRIAAQCEALGIGKD